VKALVYSPEAERDLGEIWTFTADRWFISQADTYLTQLLDALDNVAAGRLTGTDASDVRPGHRRLLVGSHVAFYTEAASQIIVIRVLHQSMDADRHLDD
jgi:toxin ParE1/3/4